MKKPIKLTLPDELQAWLEQRAGTNIDILIINILRQYKDNTTNQLARWHKRMEDPIERNKERDRVSEACSRIGYNKERH